MIKIKTPNNILVEIETLVSQKGLTYIDAMLHYCDKNQIEPDVLGEMVRSSHLFKQKVQLEAEDLNFLPKTNRLPI